MDWSGIPSLTSLRAYEALARLGSFSAAARELNVTHAAVAQHVRGLEDFFSAELAYRQGRGMELTASGRRLATALQDGFSTIATGVQDLTDESSLRPLRISVTPSFAENWLMPRLGAFWADHPEVEVELKPTERLVDMRHDGIDMAVRYGRGDWPGLTAVPLASAGNIVVGTPGLVQGGQVTSSSEFGRYHWVLDRGHREARVWTAARGLDLDKMQVTWFDTNTLALSAVRAGLGLSLQPAALVGRDLETGNLVAVTKPVVDDLGYYMVTLAGRETPALRKLTRWLVRAAG